MSFYRKYELLKLIRDGEAKTFQAKERATGKAVLLHLLQGVWEAPGDVPGVVERGEFAGQRYVVTEAVEPFPGLREWWEGQRKPSPPPPAPRWPKLEPVAKVDAPGTDTDDFSKMFGAEEPAVRQPEEAGEFTRMFGGAGTVAPRREAEPVQEGEFTRFFGSSLPAASEPVKEERVVEEPYVKPFQQAGEFTRMFGSGAAEKSPAPPKTSATGNILSGVFEEPVTPVEGPSEYTRMLRGGEEEKKEEDKAPEPVVVEKKKFPWVVVGLVVAVVVLLVLVVVWLKMRG